MNRQKHYTKSERHARLVRFEKKFKQRNISEFCRYIRLYFVYKLRAEGRMKRAMQNRKISKLEHEMRRAMGYDKYWLDRKNRHKHTGNLPCVFPEPPIC